MKTASIADSGLSWRCCRRRPRFPFAVLAAGLALFSAASLPVVQSATVQTLGGGPINLSSGQAATTENSAGFANGNTLQQAQFNLPAGVALDPAGQFLFVADTANGAVRKLDLSGNLTTTFIPGLSSPVDVAMDAATNLYVLTQGDGLVRKYDSFGNFLGILNAAALTTPTGLALNGSTNVLVTELGGAVKRINHPTNTTTTTLIGAGTFSSPRGIEVMDNGTIVVSDTGNNAIRAINPTTLAVTLLSPTTWPGFPALPAPAGTNSGPSTLAQFRAPHQITKAGNNVLIVADTGNHQVRQIDGNGTVTLLYGVDSNLWINIPQNAKPPPGWMDGTAGPNEGNAEARLPEGLVVDGSGSVYATEQYYHIIRKVTGTGLTGPSGTFGGTGGTNTAPNPPSLTISPQSGYFPMGTTVTVTSTSDQVYFTTDGTAPTTNSTPLTMVGGVGTIRWFNSTNDLTRLRVAAFLTSGTNTVSTNVAGVASTTNLVGIPGDVFAGRGATVYLPVVIDLRPNEQVKSIGFRVVVTPDSGPPPAVTSVNVIASGTNDFVGLAGVSSDGSPVSLLTIPFPNGVAVTSLSPTNYLAKGFGVTAILEVKIPSGVGVAIGNTYKVSVTNVSGTSDGSQTVVSLTNGPSRTITITNLSYLVGDTSPGRWYNAGDFGNTETNLDNSDVNNVFLASLGLKRPYAGSDAFNAMDAFPEVAGVLMGDGNITINDWLKILRRSLRLDTDNFRRGWDNGALTNSSLGAFANRVAKSVATPPGSVWFRHASITAPSVGNAVPGTDVTVPVFVNAASGISVKGLQFRAAVTPIDAAPALTARPQVIPSSFGPVREVGPDLLPLGELGAAYLADFLGRGNQLGAIRFRIPASARAGDAYAVSFSYLSGTLGDAEATLESVTARVVVLGAAPAAPASLPDQWKTHFFGSLAGLDVDPNADPDGDGVPNWKEYLAGTDPTRANSRLRLENAGFQAGVGQSQARFQLLTAPGKTYVLECTDDLGGANWTTVATFTGDGYARDFVQTNALDKSQFYRVRVLP